MIHVLGVLLISLVTPPSSPPPAPPPALDQTDAAGDDAEDEADDDEEEASTGPDPESDAGAAIDTAGDDRPRYTADILAVDLERRFTQDLASLGSIAVGFADAGRLINGVAMPREGDAWTVVVPESAWGTRETIDALSTVARVVKRQFPLVDPLRINHIGKREGGYIRPHRSHQNGRDVDLGFYYKDHQGPGGRWITRIQSMDLAANWALVRALAIETDVQVILTDRKVQKALYDYALSVGEDRAWLDTLFFSPQALLQHARRHRDHFHVRFYSPRSQELGRRVQPILAKRADENLVIHRVRNGDTLGAISRKYGSSVAMIQKRNGMRNSFLKLGRTLVVPMRGPCTQCPLPPPVVVRERRVPPNVLLASAPAGSEPPRSNSTIRSIGGAVAKPMGLSAPLE